MEREFYSLGNNDTARSATMPFAFSLLWMALQFFVVLLFFPETKGITLEDMQRKLGIV